MRTTITIDDDLLAEAKQRAARSHRTLSAVVSDALRAALVERPAESQEPYVLRVFEGKPGFAPGVDGSDWDAIKEIMYDDWPPPHDPD